METKRNSPVQEQDCGIGQPIFMPVLPPEILSTSHAALVKWRKERKVYEDTMRARCQTSGEDYNAVPRSVKDSFDRKLLEAWCRLRWQVAVDEVDDTKLCKAIDLIINSVKNDSLPDVQALFKKELYFNLKESDVSERVLQYFMPCDRIIEEHGLHSCFDSDVGSKEKCSLLINSIAPDVLQEEVKNALRYQAPGAKNDERKLHDLILLKALEHDRDFCRSKRKRTSDDVQTTRSTKVRTERIPNRRVGSENKSMWQNKRGWKTDKETQVRKQIRHDPKKKPTHTAPDRGCLKCGEEHWVAKCPEASDTEKRELPKQFHKNKGRPGEKNMKRLRDDK